MKFAALVVLGLFVGSGICGWAAEFKPESQHLPVPFDPTRSGRPFRERLSAAETPTAQRAVLYEQDPNDPQGKRAVGSVTWRTETMPPGIGKPPELAVRADVEIPERNMSVIWKLRRDTDPDRSTSHTIEIMFKLPPDFSGGGIFNVPGVWMKQAEQTQGTALAGLSVKVASGYFLIGLSGAPADKERNIQLLRQRALFDIPIVYTNNRRAILALEKGPPGGRAFADAFAAWGDAIAEAPPPLSSPLAARSDARSSTAIPLQFEGGIFSVPVLINDKLTLNFMLDSGAADVSIPADVVSTLMRTGTLTAADFLGEKTYELADGSKLPSQTFRLKSLKVGNKAIENVIGFAAPRNGKLLLGQSFLKRLSSWSIDNQRHVLVLE